VGCLTVEPMATNEVTTVRGVMPDEEIDHLRAAALLVDRGEIAPAIPHLRSHLKQHPDAPMIRAYLAELLLKVGHGDEAKTQYERFIRDAADQDGLAKHHLVHAHTKLMEIAAEADDDFHEHLHRGIALLLIVSQAADSSAVGGEALNEQTLHKAAIALKMAIRVKPGDPRPLLYLLDVQMRMNQPGAARQTRLALRVTLSDPCWTSSERERIRSAE
jgi:tetratricopeptide (TPR) repeat protein